MRRLAHFALVAVVVIVDQLSKIEARGHLLRAAPRRLGLLTLVLTTNRGAFLSIGSNLPPEVRTIIFSVAVGLGLAAAGMVLLRGLPSRGDEVALALIIGGGLGNLIDRLVFRGYVTDFLYLAAGPLHTGVFNVADVAVTCGVAWLIAAWAWSRATKRTMNDER